MSLTHSRECIYLILEQVSSGKLVKSLASDYLVDVVTVLTGNKSTAIPLLNRNRSYLHSSNFITVNDEGNYSLTPKGTRLLRKYRVRSIPTRTTWDGKWRVVLYDIPETKRKGRIAVLQILKKLGFWQLQRSVWVYPYDCEKQILYIASSYDIQSYITYMEVSYINQENKLLTHFSLTAGIQ